MFRSSLVFASVVALAGMASAQYSTVILHPGSNFGSDGRGVGGGAQVGNLSSVPGEQHASVWHGSSGSFVDLHPFSDGISNAYGTDGTQYIGYGYSTDIGLVSHALLWTGVGTNYIDLHPTGVDQSTGLAMSGPVQVGYTSQSGTSHAALWTGTAGSYVDLNPVGANGSIAMCTNGQVQGGSAFFSSGTHAALWSVSAGSFADIHPAGFDNSQVYAIGAGFQIGMANGAFDGFLAHAIMWNGSAASAIDITPVGFQQAVATASANGQIVGYAIQPGQYQAILWTGTNTAINLGAFLPGGYTDSFAWGLDATKGDIAGQAYNSVEQRYEAVMWHPTVPEPASIAVIGLGITAL